MQENSSKTKYLFVDFNGVFPLVFDPESKKHIAIIQFFNLLTEKYGYKLISHSDSSLDFKKYRDILNQKIEVLKKKGEQIKPLEFLDDADNFKENLEQINKYTTKHGLRSNWQSLLKFSPEDCCILDDSLTICAVAARKNYNVYHIIAPTLLNNFSQNEKHKNLYTSTLFDSLQHLIEREEYKNLAKLLIINSDLFSFPSSEKPSFKKKDRCCLIT